MYLHRLHKLFKGSTITRGALRIYIPYGFVTVTNGGYIKINIYKCISYAVSNILKIYEEVMDTIIEYIEPFYIDIGHTFYITTVNIHFMDSVPCHNDRKVFLINIIKNYDNIKLFQRQSNCDETPYLEINHTDFQYNQSSIYMVQNQKTFTLKLMRSGSYTIIAKTFSILNLLLHQINNV